MAQDRSALLALALANLPTNNVREITAAMLREVVAGLVESQFNLVDDAALLTPLDLEAKVNKAGDTMTGQLSLVGDPVSDNHAARKAYVDAAVAAVVNGVSWKRSVRGVVVDVAGPSAPVLSGTYTTLDGVALAVGNRVIVNSTVNPVLNGIYVVAAGAWSRSEDANTGAELLGASAAVEEGTNFGDKILLVSTNGPITIGTTPITWVTFAQPNNYTAGAGLSLTGNQFAVDATVQRRTVTPGTQTGNAINLDTEIQTRATVSGTPEAISITSFTNTGVGKSIRLRLSSANTGDSFSIAVAGQTIRQVGYSFIPGQLHFIDIAHVGTNEYLCAIIPVL